MGGRGRDFTSSDRWAWVGELSDSRLEQYGKMSSYKDESNIGKMALNYEAAKEFERRHGYTPEWKK